MHRHLEICKRGVIACAIILGTPALHAASQVVDVKVTIAGFEPASLHVKPDSPVTLKVTRTTDATCATEIVVPDLKIKRDLPLNKTVSVPLGRLKKGDIRFGCGMNMMLGGVVQVQ